MTTHYGGKMVLSDIKDRLGSMVRRSDDVELSDEYVELEASVPGSRAKIQLRPFVLENFEGINPILQAIREGYTIALINIAPIKDSDRVGLKRAIEKLKKTLEANDGDIAGFGENWLVATPSFARVYRGEDEKADAPDESETSI